MNGIGITGLLFLGLVAVMIATYIYQTAIHAPGGALGGLISPDAPPGMTFIGVADSNILQTHTDPDTHTIGNGYALPPLQALYSLYGPDGTAGQYKYIGVTTDGKTYDVVGFTTLSPDISLVCSSREMCTTGSQKMIQCPDGYICGCFISSGDQADMCGTANSGTIYYAIYSMS